MHRKDLSRQRYNPAACRFCIDSTLRSLNYSNRYTNLLYAPKGRKLLILALFTFFLQTNAKFFQADWFIKSLESWTGKKKLALCSIRNLLCFREHFSTSCSCFGIIHRLQEKGPCLLVLRIQPRNL